ncbi:hypothetical protein [Dankookia sp. P2]|uniref:hypothetical protein n=1 Tax=Dankookia sp. P2 TaxID=3423955 RepID=UPI003D668EB7
MSDALAALERWPGNVTAALERIRAANSGRGTTRAGVILPLRRWLNRMPAGRGTVLREFVDTYR